MISVKYKILSVCLLFIVSFGIQSCNKSDENRWYIEVDSSKTKVQSIDISKEYYDPNTNFEEFKQKYAWFQGTVPDDIYVERRTDSLEIALYKEAISKVNVPQLENQLSDLFAHIKHYYPTFHQPKVYLYSSALGMVKEGPVVFMPDMNALFIDVSSFMGEKSKFYDGLEEYYKTSMNPENIIVKATDALISNMVPFDKNNQKFIDLMVYQGKKKVLMDAFLPKVEHRLKMNYSQKQYNWAAANEDNIWNYFVENDLVFSSDPNLVNRFITEGPFSKFYTEVDQKSSPQVGIYIGWQICNAFLAEQSDITLQDFLKMNATDLFNESKYNPNK